MSDAPRLVLIHATRLAMGPIEHVLREHWPEAEAISILEEGLAIDRAKPGASDEDLDRRIVALARYGESISADGILFTCSAFGDGIEEAANTSPLPVLKPNESMFKSAFGHGSRVVMVFTFQPAVAGMEKEFYEEAARRLPGATIRSVHAEGARDALQAGDEMAHNQIIASTVAQVVDADVILLAHFSMAPAGATAREATDIPVLTSPEAAVDEMKSLIAQTKECA